MDTVLGTASGVDEHQPLRIVHLVTRSHHRGAEVFALELALAASAIA